MKGTRMLTFKVESNWEAGKPGTRSRAGKHEIVIDEPVSAGGNDLGPNPMQYLLSSLGGCFIAMGRMVAGEMGLKIDHMRCRVEGDINPDGLAEKDPAVRPGLQEVRLAFDVKSAEPADKIAAWLKKVEKRCPVKDCLEHPVTVKVVEK